MNLCITSWLQNDAEIDNPYLYNVFIHNDDFTPMDFVIRILEKFFSMEHQQALSVMLEAHAKGIARCGSYTKDIAETKISLVANEARSFEFPLLCSMEGA